MKAQTHKPLSTAPFHPTKLRHWIALAGGAGLSPYAPGTCGTLVGIPIWFLLSFFSLENYLVAILIAFFIGVYACRYTAQDMDERDPGAIVWDEVVGFLVTMTLAPAGWAWVIIGFILFRIFDITKPSLIGMAERKFDGGFGIMLDDVIAGLFAAIAMQLCYFLHKFFALFF